MEAKDKKERAIFNLQRFQILQTKLNPSTSNLIPDSYAYAWYKKLYPLLDDSELHEDLEDYFEITKEQVDIISQRADSEWLEKRYYTFNEYESYFGVRRSPIAGISRHTLIATFRYLFLHGTFDEKFWETLIKPMEHPSEASRVTSEFNIEYIYLV
jgi:antitoxin MazE